MEHPLSAAVLATAAVLAITVPAWAQSSDDLNRQELSRITMAPATPVAPVGAPVAPGYPAAYPAPAYPAAYPAPTYPYYAYPYPYYAYPYSAYSYPYYGYPVVGVGWGWGGGWGGGWHGGWHGGGRGHWHR
jgi:hypothetical protein